MSSIRALRASFAFDEAVPLFTDVEFHLPDGWTGLVGANGAGKTTLLRLLSQELPPTSGSFAFEPERPLVVLCRQEVESLTADVRSLAESWDPVSFRLRARLDLDPDAVSRWATLSPGERKRWQIAAALAGPPDVLLLDEPTNHLDAPGRAWLENALRGFRGVGVLVSHDRALLDALTTRTLRADAGTVRLWPFPYSEARKAWEEERRAKEREYAEAREVERALQARLRDARATQARIVANLSVGRRMKGPKDSDARTLGADFRVQQAEKRVGREVAVVRREAERARADAESFQFEREVGRNLFLDYAPASRPVLAHLPEGTISTPAGEPLFHTPALTLRRDDRLHLAGPNGAGKTTLVHALLDAAALPPERVVHLPQELRAEDGLKLLERVRALRPDVRGRVLSLVAALGVDPDRLLRSASPSPGEARKLLVADGLGRHAWALVLDEPTNHLDLPSVERLEAALAQWPGGLLLVTHDAHFARRTCTTRWEISGRALVQSAVA